MPGAPAPEAACFRKVRVCFVLVGLGWAGLGWV